VELEAKSSNIYRTFGLYIIPFYLKKYINEVNSDISVANSGFFLYMYVRILFR